MHKTLNLISEKNRYRNCDTKAIDIEDTYNFYVETSSAAPKETAKETVWSNIHMVFLFAPFLPMRFMVWEMRRFIGTKTKPQAVRPSLVSFSNIPKTAKINRTNEKIIELLPIICYTI